MTKLKFLLSLHDKLSELPQDEVEERLSFYSEIIEDRMEEGLSEEEAVSAVGSVDEIASQIVADIPLTKIVKEKIKPAKKLKAWEIILLVLGSPIWLSLVVSAVAVIFSLYISLWSVIVSLWAVFGSLIGCAIGFIIAGIGIFITGNDLTGIAMLGSGLVCTGLSVFMFYGCKAITNGTLLLTKKIALGIKKSFIKKEEA